MRQIYKLQITSAAMGDQARGGRRQFNAVQVCVSTVCSATGGFAFQAQRLILLKAPVLT